MGTHSVGRETGADRSAYSGTTGWVHHEFTAGRPPGRSVSNLRLCLPVTTYKHHLARSPELALLAVAYRNVMLTDILYALLNVPYHTSTLLIKSSSTTARKQRHMNICPSRDQHYGKLAGF